LIKFELNVDAAAEVVGGEEAEEHKRGISFGVGAQGQCQYTILHAERAAKIINDTVNSTNN
jgi:hypothetical protein